MGQKLCSIVHCNSVGGRRAVVSPLSSLWVSVCAY